MKRVDAAAIIREIIDFTARSPLNYIPEEENIVAQRVVG